MKAVGKASRKALSPLLAIIIGLVVTVVAGILLAQLYFSYAATISKRPAANIEYIDLVTSGTTSVLAVSIKNMGNVEILAADVVDSGNNTICSISGVPAGGTGGCSKSLGTTVPVGETWSGSVWIAFSDGSKQVYAIVARARSA